MFAEKNLHGWANSRQHLDILKRHSPSTASKDFYGFLNELDEAGACQKERVEENWVESLAKATDDEAKTRAYNIQRAGDAREKIRFRGKTEAEGVKLWTAEECTALERDFTTNGTPGKLGCPFAARNGRKSSNASIRGGTMSRSSISRGSIGRRSKRASFHDPISADMTGLRPKTADGSVEGSVPLCPIRFLEQHSPEEVAQYFEKHKHELPRSHETCIKRFQENDVALKNLDSKYSSMVFMLNDLGKKHAPLLPEPDDVAVDDEDGDEMPANPASKVERWAQDVEEPDVDHDIGAEKNEIEVEEERKSRFDRSLKDVQLGESPSRPWGIHVPEDFAKDEAASKKSDPTASPLEPATAVDESSNPHYKPPFPADHPFINGGGQCPFNGLAAPKHEAAVESQCGESNKRETHFREESDQAPEQPAAGTKDDGGKRPVFLPDVRALERFGGPKFVFNGPVFFGYSTEQTATLMQSFLSKADEH
jgi:hypothetical protein